MIRVKDAVTRIQRLIRSDHMTEDDLLPLLQTRYEHVYETYQWASRKREIVISTVAQVSNTTTDTVTVTLNSQTVTSAGTPFTSAMDGRQIQIGDEPTPLFLTYSSTSVVTLQDGEGTTVTWPRATDTAASWRVFKTLYPMPSGFDMLLWLGTDVPLVEYPSGREGLNRFDPNRLTTDSQPRYWCHAGTTTDTTPLRQIELWPVPTAGRIIRGEYQREAPALVSTTMIDLRTPLIIYATAADALNALYAREGDDSTRQLALFYERKANEVMNDYGPAELARESVPNTFGRSRRSQDDLRGDWLVNHNALEDFS